MILFDYLPGVALGLGLWLGLRWPAPAIRIAALLGVVVALALAVIAGLPDGAAQAEQNQRALGWAVIPGLAAYLVALGLGALLRAKGGGGME